MSRFTICAAPIIRGRNRARNPFFKSWYDRGMKKNGRPTRYGEEIGDKLARFIREGLTIKDVMR